MSVELRVLGELQVVRDGRRLDMPQSKKTKALLAYLGVTGRPHRRERLCDLFWDLADDPRAALRWSLSKLRPLLDDQDKARIVANRETVALDGVSLDLDDLREALGAGSADPSSADMFRGELLEDLDMLNLLDYQAWLVAEREEVRAKRIRVLDALLAGPPLNDEERVVYARSRVNVDPYNVEARAQFIRILQGAGRSAEAEEQYRAGCRLAAEIGASTAPIEKARRENRDAKVAPPAPVKPTNEPKTPLVSHATDLVGRSAERTQLANTLDDVGKRRRARAVLIEGEPGIGKTALGEDLVKAAQAGGATVLTGAAFEAETGRPYGPWIEAFREVRSWPSGLHCRASWRRCCRTWWRKQTPTTPATGCMVVWWSCLPPWRILRR